MTAQTKIEGLDALVRKLNALGENTDEIIDRGLHKGALKIQTAAKEKLSEKGAVDTGELRRRISVEHYTDGSEHGYVVGTNVGYAPYVEFGTGTKGDTAVPHTAKRSWRYKDRDGNWHTCYGMSARPFMRPAFAENKTYTGKAVRAELLRVLQRRHGR